MSVVDASNEQVTSYHFEGPDGTEKIVAVTHRGGALRIAVRVGRDGALMGQAEHIIDVPQGFKVRQIRGGIEVRPVAWSWGPLTGFARPDYF